LQVFSENIPTALDSEAHNHQGLWGDFASLHWDFKPALQVSTGVFGSAELFSGDSVRYRNTGGRFMAFRTLRLIVIRRKWSSFSKVLALGEYLRLLDLGPYASMADLEQARIDLLRVWNPDNYTDDHHLWKRATEQTARINTAYRGLKPLFLDRPGTKADTGLPVQKTDLQIPRTVVRFPEQDEQEGSSFSDMSETILRVLKSALIGCAVGLPLSFLMLLQFNGVVAGIGLAVALIASLVWSVRKK
jgi:hypothetical protein